MLTVGVEDKLVADVVAIPTVNKDTASSHTCSFVTHHAPSFSVLTAGDGLTVVVFLDGTVEVLTVGVEDELVADVVAVPAVIKDTASSHTCSFVTPCTFFFSIVSRGWISSCIFLGWHS